MPRDGRLEAVARFEQVKGISAGFEKLEFEEGDVIKIISASVDNSY